MKDLQELKNSATSTDSCCTMNPRTCVLLLDKRLDYCLTELKLVRHLQKSKKLN